MTLPHSPRLLSTRVGTFRALLRTSLAARAPLLSGAFGGLPIQLFVEPLLLLMRLLSIGFLSLCLCFCHNYFNVLEHWHGHDLFVASLLHSFMRQQPLHLDALFQIPRHWRVDDLSRRSIAALVHAATTSTPQHTPCTPWALARRQSVRPLASRCAPAPFAASLGLGLLSWAVQAPLLHCLLRHDLWRFHQLFYHLRHRNNNLLNCSLQTSVILLHGQLLHSLPRCQPYQLDKLFHLRHWENGNRHALDEVCFSPCTMGRCV